MHEVCSHLKPGIFIPSLEQFSLEVEGEVLILKESGLKTKLGVQGCLGRRERV